MMAAQQIEVVREEELTGCGRRRRTGSRGGVTLKEVETTPRSGPVFVLSISAQAADALAMHSFMKRGGCMRKERDKE